MRPAGSPYSPDTPGMPGTSGPSGPAKAGATGALALGAPAARAFATRSRARVAATRPIGSLVWLTLDVPDWPGALPGQFALLQPEDSTCFLGRALSVAWQDQRSVSFLIAPVGEGTREICALHEGDRIWILGPLGNGFDVAAMTGGARRLVLVGGGVGMAPFPLLLAHLGGAGASTTAAGGRPEILVLLGFRDAAQADGAEPLLDVAAALKQHGVACRAEVVTEDGSRGRAEKVTDTLERELSPGDRLAVCGPRPMVDAVDRISASRPGVQAWFSLEAAMACGVGSCHGCVVPLVDGTYARVCREGPVFGAESLLASGTAGPARRAAGCGAAIGQDAAGVKDVTPGGAVP